MSGKNKEVTADDIPDIDLDNMQDIGSYNNESGNVAQSNDEVEKLNQEIAELKDKYLRAMAEAENTRIRYSKEAEERGIYAVSNFAREVISLSDNLRRTIATFKEETTSNPVLEGILMIEKQLQSTLNRFNIKEVDAIGLVFNPNLHEALFEAKDETKDDGVVIQVVEAGYVIGDRLLRPAKVGVNKKQ